MDKVKALATDLRTGYPRSPRDTAIAGCVIAARAVDKCRATLAGVNGEYHFDCSLDKRFFTWAEVDSAALKEFVATGADDAAVSDWVTAHAKAHTAEEIAVWNNEQRDRRMSDLSPKAQASLEDYVKKNLPAGSILYQYFDLYDIEEKRIAPRRQLGSQA
jgi:hypothetical protein